MSSESSTESNSKTFSPVWPLLAIAAIDIFTPFVPVNSQGAAIAFGASLTVVYVIGIVLFALGIARKEYSIPVAAAMFAVCAIAWCGVEYGMQPRLTEFMKMVRLHGAQLTTTQQLTLVYVSALRDIALIGGASFVGALLARGIRHSNMLVPVGVVLAGVDTVGVLFQGPVARLLHSEATQPLAQKAMTSGPRIGSAVSGPVSFSVPLPDVGMGDFLFLALLLCVLVNLKMNWRTSAILMGVFVSVALLGLTFIPVFPPLPGLVFIGAGAVLPNLKYFSYTREEKFALLWAGLLVVVLITGLYIGFKIALPE